MTIPKVNNSSSLFIKQTLCVIFIALTLGVLSLGYTVILAKIGAAFPDVERSTIQSLNTIVNYGAMISAVVAGFVATKISVKNILIIALGLTGVLGVLPFFVRGSFEVLYVCRLLVGFCQGMLAPCAIKFIMTCFEPGTQRTVMMGFQAGFMRLGMVLTSTLSGILANSGFEATFLLFVIPLIGAVVVALCMPVKSQASDFVEGAVAKKGATFKDYKTLLTWQCVVFVFLLLFYQIGNQTYNNNISFYVEDFYGGDATITGNVTSITNILAYILAFGLGIFHRVTKNYLSPSQCAVYGAGLLVMAFMPGQPMTMTLAALLMGYGSGAIAQHINMCCASLVRPEGIAIAAAIPSFMTYIARAISVPTMNGLSNAVMGDTSASSVFTVCGVFMIVVGIAYCAYVAWLEKNPVKFEDGLVRGLPKPAPRKAKTEA